jgi:hypothetical protein
MKELWKNLWKPLCWLVLAAAVYIWHPVDLEDRLLMDAFALLWVISWTFGKAEEAVHKRLNEISKVAEAVNNRLNEIEEKIDELLNRDGEKIGELLDRDLEL